MPDPYRHSNPETPSHDEKTFVRRYTWIIVKNVLGWLLILSALVVAGVVPIPLGTPMFLIGFALITLPGKRRMTSGALRGIRIKLYTRKSQMWRLAISLLLPPTFVWLLEFQRHAILHPSQMTLLRLCGLYAAAIVVAWIFIWIVLLGLNLVIRFLPKTRRHVRPWLRDHGINLLPPRRKIRGIEKQLSPDDQQILGFGRARLFRGNRNKKK
jgi:hypothetical protein